MANLAIRGHKTRSKEVIEILEMLGGVNKWSYLGDRLLCTYYINCEGIINYTSNVKGYNLQVFTLEEFLEKFPYKVGDKVIFTKYGDNDVVTVESMSWTGTTIEYNYNGGVSCLAKDLQPYKEEIMDKANKAVFDANAQCCDIMNNLIKEETTEVIIKMNPLEMSGARCVIPIPKGYKFAGVDDDKQQVVFEKICCQYPKTYEECCQYLGCDDKIKMQLIGQFTQLINARNAYWKIAGEQMGLDKPWSPSKSDSVYCIFRYKGDIVKNNFVFGDSLILEFPTEEMRDAFYENFKELINETKELL